MFEERKKEMDGMRRINQIFDEVGVGDSDLDEIIRKEQTENYKNNTDETGYLETPIQVSSRFRFAECDGADSLFFMARTDIRTNKTKYVLMYGKQQNFGFKKLMEKQYEDYYEALNSFQMANNIVHQLILESSKSNP